MRSAIALACLLTAPIGATAYPVNSEKPNPSSPEWRHNLEIRRRFPLPSQFSEKDKEAAKALAKSATILLNSQLTDYPSARFQNVKAFLRQSWNSFNREYFICGDINSKNRMGGYSGWNGFIIESAEMNSGKIDFLEEGDIVGDAIIPEFCRDSFNNRTIGDGDPVYGKILTTK